MKIAITQKHIDSGVKADCSQCVLALALLDAGFVRAAVTYDRVYVTDASFRDESYRLAGDALALVTDFDYGDRVQPCEVELLP